MQASMPENHADILGMLASLGAAVLSLKREQPKEKFGDMLWELAETGRFLPLDAVMSTLDFWARACGHDVENPPEHVIEKTKRFVRKHEEGGDLAGGGNTGGPSWPK